MSEDIGSFRSVTLTEFGSREHGPMLQVNGDIGPPDRGYIQITRDEARWLSARLRRWLVAKLEPTEDRSVSSVMRALLLITRRNAGIDDMDDGTTAAWVLVDYIESLEDEIARLRADKGPP